MGPKTEAKRQRVRELLEEFGKRPGALQFIAERMGISECAAANLIVKAGSERIDRPGGES